MHINELQERVNAYIASLPYDRQPASLYAPISYTLAAGGKRLRPVLTLLTYAMYGNDIDRVLPVATAVETYHNYTLLHDDLLDNSELRRGRPTAHCVYGPTTTILASEAMVVQAFQAASQCGDSEFRPLFNVLADTALQIAEGQQLDVKFETRDDVTEEEYLQMIRLKTSVLLGCAVKMGAILGGANSDDQDRLYRFAENLGLAFQLQDDYLDVYGNPAVFGKPIGGDIVNNKKTFLLINAFNRASESQRQQLKKWTEATNFDAQEKISAVTQLYNQLSIPELTLSRIEEYYAEANGNLDAVALPEETKRPLKEYMQTMLNRKS